MLLTKCGLNFLAATLLENRECLLPGWLSLISLIKVNFGYHFEKYGAKMLSGQCKLNAFLIKEQLMNMLEAG